MNSIHQGSSLLVPRAIVAKNASHYHQVLLFQNIWSLTHTANKNEDESLLFLSRTKDKGLAHKEHSVTRDDHQQLHYNSDDETSSVDTCDLQFASPLSTPTRMIRNEDEKHEYFRENKRKNVATWKLTGSWFIAFLFLWLSAALSSRQPIRFPLATSISSSTANNIMTHAVSLTCLHPFYNLSDNKDGRSDPFNSNNAILATRQEEQEWDAFFNVLDF